jgi:hypothetical protein
VKTSPLGLLILGSLRYLGRGFTFDDCEESTAISEEVHRVFFHKFIEVGKTVLFEKWVIAPSNAAEAKDHLREFEMAGMPGCIASFDGTHVVHEKCSYRLNRLHKGCKSKNTTRAFNLGANHRRQIICSTTGHPGSWNDKTLVLFDSFLSKLKNGLILQDNEFYLLERRDGSIVSVKYRGAWVVVDNGYLSWAITVPPYTHTQDRPEIRWSEWIESMRKDVECTFGILKGRWRILKSGVRLHGTDSVDAIWMTCCALHNMLLESDGLNQPWDGKSVPTSEWSGDLGDFEDGDIPAPFLRIVNPSNVRAFDTSTVGTPTVVSVSEELDPEAEAEAELDIDESTGEEVRIVKNLSMKFFRSKLVEHFDIKWQRGEIVWPRSRGPVKRCYVDAV